jgi:hypothetical protein
MTPQDVQAQQSGKIITVKGLIIPFALNSNI